MDSMHSTSSQTRKSGHSHKSSYSISNDIQPGGEVVLTIDRSSDWIQGVRIGLCEPVL